MTIKSSSGSNENQKGRFAPLAQEEDMASVSLPGAHAIATTPVVATAVDEAPAVVQAEVVDVLTDARQSYRQQPGGVGGPLAYPGNPTANLFSFTNHGIQQRLQELMLFEGDGPFVVEELVYKPHNIEVHHGDGLDCDKLSIVRKWKTSWGSPTLCFTAVWNFIIGVMFCFMIFVDCDSPNVKCEGDPFLGFLALGVFGLVGVFFILKELQFFLNSTFITVSRSARTVTVETKPLPPLRSGIANVDVRRTRKMVCRCSSGERVNDQPIYRYRIMAVDGNKIETEVVPGIITQLQDALFILQEMEHHLGLKERPDGPIDV